jgi:8-oxo-dGTP pyrophosphatase MutT (NUDIX family)
MESKYNKRSKTRYSYGIALIRDLDNSPKEVLIVRDRVTYAFREFIYKKYDGKKVKLEDLFNNMTVDEKLLLLKYDFESIWYHLWLGFLGEDQSKFEKFKEACRSHYIEFCQMNRGELLPTLMSSNIIGPKPWGLPKGKKRDHETEIECAQRELKEETELEPTDYKILYDIAPIVTTYPHNGTNYVSTIYIAILTRPVTPRVNVLNTGMVSEIDCIEWKTLKAIVNMSPENGNKYFASQMKIIFDKLRGYIKKNGKSKIMS